MSDSIAELRSTHPAHLANRPDPEPAAVVPARDGERDPDWSAIKQVLVDLYAGGLLGPISLEDLFERIPDLRDA